MRANLRYEKNQKREDVKSHHYIISFDPRDGTANGLTVDRAQELGEQFCKAHFPGHQALICTHPDGHNPVSYTHLDVYKRQVENKAYDVSKDANQNLQSLEQIRQNVDDEITDSQKAKKKDVYKRQVLDATMRKF